MIQKNRSTLLVYIVIAFFTFQLDRITKELALSKAVERYELNPFLAFDLVINRGVTGGLLHTDSDSWFLMLTALIMCIIFVLGFYAWRRYFEGKSIIGEILVLSGAISNVIDRFVYGGVIDFIHFSFGGYSFPVFNIADVCIVLGVAIIFFEHIRE